jgi:ABC-type transport system involved in multi-copper enzyme maturation permease subunit
MTWVAWRVQRPQYVAAAVVVAFLALWLAAVGLDGHTNWSVISDHADVVALYVLPGMLGLGLGLGLGAPVVGAELDRATHRVAWTQSVSRTRWLAHKLMIGALLCAGLVALLVPLVEWWTRATHSELDISPKVFAITGAVSVGYALFAFALGAALGAVIRRPGWAFAASVPIAIAVRLVVDALRPSLASLAYVVQPSMPVTYVNPKGWVLNSAYVPLGRLTPLPGRTWLDSAAKWMNSCVGNVQTPARFERAAYCARAANLHYVIQYEPEHNYWSLQGTETAIFVGIAAALVAITVLAVRRSRA